MKKKKISRKWNCLLIGNRKGKKGSQLEMPFIRLRREKLICDYYVKNIQTMTRTMKRLFSKVFLSLRKIEEGEMSRKKNRDENF